MNHIFIYTLYTPTLPHNAHKYIHGTHNYSTNSTYEHKQFHLRTHFIHIYTMSSSMHTHACIHSIYQGISVHRCLTNVQLSPFHQTLPLAYMLFFFHRLFYFTMDDHKLFSHSFSPLSLHFQTFLCFLSFEDCRHKTLKTPL